jgi:hypothetical protein
MKSLCDHGLCESLSSPKLGPYGSAPNRYRLARLGRNYLGLNGRYRRSEGIWDYRTVRHLFAVNDFLITLELLAREYPETVSLARTLHDLDLQRTPVPVDVDGHRVYVVPDAWVDLEIQGQGQMCLVAEIDRGTEEGERWREKCRALLAYACGPYQDFFGVEDILTFVVATTDGEGRLANLLRWTEEEIQRIGADQDLYRDLFRFTAADIAPWHPEQLFFSSCWYRPFDPTPIQLISFEVNIPADEMVVA